MLADDNKNMKNYPACKELDNEWPSYMKIHNIMGVQWLSGRVLDSRPRGRGFEPHRHHCVAVLEHDTFILA